MKHSGNLHIHTDFQKIYKMDSTQLKKFFDTLCIQALMMWAFANIDGFNEHFLTFFISLLGDSVNIDSLQKRLQDIFLKDLRSTLESGSHMLLLRLLRNNVHDDDVTDETVAHHVSHDPKRWKNAFRKLKNEVVCEQNQRFTSLSWALENLGIFTDIVQKYMVDFAKTRGLRLHSIDYTEHFAELKNDLQDMMNAYVVRKKREHDDICGDYYFGSSEQYFQCSYCMSRLKIKWVKLLDEWIYDQKRINAFYAERTHDFSSTDTNIDIKDKSRRDFVGKSKGRLREKERRLRKKGTLTKDSRKELRVSRDLLKKA